MEIFGFKIERTALLILAVLALLISGALVVTYAIGQVKSMVATARVEASAARDAYWKSEIERSNAAAHAEVMQLQASLQADVNARTKLDNLNEAFANLEAANAAMPETGTNAIACGLGRGHVGLLPN